LKGRLDYGDYGMHHAGHGIFAWLFLILFAILVAAAIFALIRLAKRPAGGAGPATAPVLPTDSALQELRVRYARGDIGREEYMQRATDLGDPNLPAAATSAPQASP